MIAAAAAAVRTEVAASAVVAVAAEHRGFAQPRFLDGLIAHSVIGLRGLGHQGPHPWKRPKAAR